MVLRSCHITAYQLHHRPGHGTTQEVLTRSPPAALARPICVSLSGPPLIHGEPGHLVALTHHSLRP